MKDFESGLFIGYNVVMLTIIDQQENPIYEPADFADIFPPDEINTLQVPENKDFDGSIIAQVPAQTTHLLMRIIDKIDASELKHLPNLQYIGICSTGWWDKYFNAELLQKHGVVVTNNPSYAINAVAEGVFATLLSLKRHLPELPMGTITTELPVGSELHSKTLGILGLGRIGTKVATIGNGFGMNVITTSQKPVPHVQNVEHADFLAQSDVISLHVPMSAGVVLHSDDFKHLRDNVTIVNSAGYELLDASALYDFLNTHPESHYIDLSYPSGEWFERTKLLRNAHFYPLFSNQTVEAFAGKRQIPIDTLRDFVKTGDCDNIVIVPADRRV